MNPQRINLENIFSNKLSISDQTYSGAEQIIEEEKCEIIRYRRTKIIYSQPKNLVKKVQLTPELNLINFIEWNSPSKTLFSSLFATSELIRVFAECEQKEVPLKVFGRNEPLLKRFEATVSTYA